MRLLALALLVSNAFASPEALSSMTVAVPISATPVPANATESLTLTVTPTTPVNATAASATPSFSITPIVITIPIQIPLPGGLVNGIVAGLDTDLTDVALIASAVLQAIGDLVPKATQTSIPEAISDLKSLISTDKKIIDTAADLILSGFNPKDLKSVAAGFSPEVNSFNNSNAQAPSGTVYPQKSDEDAPYSLTENELRSCIYFPPTFTHGKKHPVILMPGTGVSGGNTYGSNYLRLLASEPSADPVLLNIPGISLRDATKSAEILAYAVNYVSDITAQNVSVISFSQGSLNVQWALKYWPSTRKVVTDFIAMSPEFAHGTVLAPLLCPQFPKIGCVPAILQQLFHSKFIQTLIGDDGDSAYVPTTTVYSATDEIVQPQSGDDAAGIIKDVRGVGVSNNEIQKVCLLTPAGEFATHEGMLYNALGYALAVDALSHDGPGKTSRLNLTDVCSRFATKGLSLFDVLAEESGLAVLAVNFLEYQPKINDEPKLPAYALK